MKKIIFSLFAISLVCVFTRCTQESKTVENKAVESSDLTKDVWADLVESKTILVKPESWEEEYWNSVNVNMDKNKIFNTVVDAVLSGKKQAYNLFTDSLFTIDEVKAMVDKNGSVNTEATELKKISADDLSMIRMREKWMFDKENFKLEKQVTRIDLLFKKLDETGQYIGDKPLFYINL
ncbi:MAG: hypothetical protein K8R85_09575 [Bacteroidetes bacterium]|nr:hypothetical protein [Bacteroidota bacterium]